LQPRLFLAGLGYTTQRASRSSMGPLRMPRNFVHQEVHGADIQSVRAGLVRILPWFLRQDVGQLRKESFCSMLQLTRLHRETRRPGKTLECIPDLRLDISDLCASFKNCPTSTIWTITGFESRYPLLRYRFGSPEVGCCKK
jgi:hypothetical protein